MLQPSLWSKKIFFPIEESRVKPKLQLNSADPLLLGRQRRLSCRKSCGKWLTRTNPQFLTSELQISPGSLAWTIYTGQRSMHTSVHHDSPRRSLEHWFCCGNQERPANTDRKETERDKDRLAGLESSGSCNFDGIER